MGSAARAIRRHDGPVDVLHLLYGGTGGQAAVVRDLAAGLRSVGLTSGAVLHARPAELDVHTENWRDIDALWVIPRRARVDPTVSRSLRSVFARQGARAFVTHIPYAGRAISRARSDGSVASAVFVEHHALDRRTWRHDLRSRRMIGRVAAVALLSEAYLEQYPLRDRALHRGTSLVLLPNGVDIRQFRPTDTSERTVDRAFRLGMAGGMTRGKDQATLVRAVASLREAEMDVHLVLMGDGPERAELERLTARLGLSSAVTFTGQLPPLGLAEQLRALDVYVQSSQGETQSTAILQAQASGLPVVGTRVSGIIGAVREGVDGLLVEPESAESLSAAIRLLAERSDLARAYGRSARDRVAREFSLERMTHGYLDLFDRLDPTGPWRKASARLEAPPHGE